MDLRTAASHADVLRQHVIGAELTVACGVGPGLVDVANRRANGGQVLGIPAAALQRPEGTVGGLVVTGPCLFECLVDMA